MERLNYCSVEAPTVKGWKAELLEQKQQMKVWCWLLVVAVMGLFHVESD